MIPRKFPVAGNTLTLELRNELTGALFTPDFDYLIGEYLNITMVQISDFKIQNKYNFKIRNNGEIISSGKILFLKEGTSVQDYNYQQQSNDYYKY